MRALSADRNAWLDVTTPPFTLFTVALGEPSHLSSRDKAAD